MAKLNKFGAVNSCARSLVAGIALLMLGCQPQALPEKSDQSPVPSQSVSLPLTSRLTEGTATKVAPASPTDPDNADTSTANEKASGDGEPSVGAPADRPVVDSAAHGKAGEGAKPPVRPTARRPAIPGEPLEISFDDLVIGMQADVVYRPWMLTERAKEIDGQTVRLVGYVHPGVDKQKHIKELVLLRNLECKFGPGGQADHLVMVRFKPGVEATFTQNAVEVQGVLKVNPWQGADGNTWSLYDLDGTAFKDLRRK